jgi:hypothetical protein
MTRGLFVKEQKSTKLTIKMEEVVGHHIARIVCWRYIGI